MPVNLAKLSCEITTGDRKSHNRSICLEFKEKGSALLAPLEIVPCGAMSLNESFIQNELALCTSIVFDVDGTLVRSEPIIQRTILTTVQGYLTPGALRDFESHIAPIKAECFGYSEDIFSAKLLAYLSSRSMLQAELAALDEASFFQRFSEDRYTLYVRFCEQGLVTPMPGAVDFVRECFRRYGALAINTGSHEIHSSPMLRLVFKNHLDLEQVFPHRLRTFVNNLPHGTGKPNPDGYLRAAQLLQISPWQLGAVVDRGNDCISALRAGYRVVFLVPEDGDRKPLEAPRGKHSLVQFFSSLPESERESMKARVIILDSLEELSAPSLDRVA